MSVGRYIVIAPHGWGRGPTLNHARRNAADHASSMKEYTGYLLPGEPTLYNVEPDGTLSWPESEPSPIRVIRKWPNGAFDRTAVPVAGL